MGAKPGNLGVVGAVFALALLLGPLHAFTPTARAQAQETEYAQDNPASGADEKSDDNAGSSEGQASGKTSEVEEEADSNALGKADRSAPPAEILRDLSVLPFPARRMHELLVEATKSGDIERLREFIGTGDDATMLSLGGLDGDPIDFLKSQSGDPDGHEILAILLEVLEAGFVHLDIGTENEVYVWPYFFAVPLDKLTPPQRVEMFTILTSGDLEEMKTFGAYVFFRVGISPQGRWRFFVAGD